MLKPSYQLLGEKNHPNIVAKPRRLGFPAQNERCIIKYEDVTLFGVDIQEVVDNEPKITLISLA
jgi:hypothetical protein